MDTTNEKPDGQRRKVRVACSVPNGIQLRLNQPGPGGAGEPMVGQGAPVVLTGPSSANTGAGAQTRTDLGPAITEVDEEFWRAWADQHKNDPLLTGGSVHCLDDAPSAEQAKNDQEARENNEA
jgi:hypothetical protein